MKRSKDPKVAEMGRKLQSSLNDDLVDYLYFRQEFDAMGDLKPMTLEQFDIRNKNLKPSEKKK